MVEEVLACCCYIVGYSRVSGAGAGAAVCSELIISDESSGGAVAQLTWGGTQTLTQFLS